MVKITGNAVVLTSALKLATIKKLEKYNPDSLCLCKQVGEDTEEIFRISTGASSSIQKFGIVFAEEDKDGYATATVLLPNGIKGSKKDFVKENFYTVLLMLKDIEDASAIVCADLEKAFAKLDKEIVEE